MIEIKGLLQRIDSLEVTRFLDRDLLCRRARLLADLLHCIDYVHPFDDFAEHDVFAIEVMCWCKRDVKLRAICVRTRVGHRQESSFAVLMSKVFVAEAPAIDRLATRAVGGGNITTLRHEARDDAMEYRTSIVQRLTNLSMSFLACAELAEVF